MKRSIKSVLSLVLICCMIFGGINVIATEKGEVAIENVSGKPGETIEIYVNLTNNPGIVSLYLGVGYDENVLKLNSITNTGLLPDYMAGSMTKNPVAISWEAASATENLTVTGTLAVLKFTVLENARPGEYAITVGQYENNTPYDVDLNDVEFTYKSGKITVEIPDHDHVFGEWKSVKEATCTEEGKKERTCTVEGCLEKEAQDVSALGHDYGEWKTVLEPTISEVGREERVCKRCSNVERREIPKIQHGENDHVFNGRTETLAEADCIHDGKIRTYCSFDGCTAYRDSIVSALGHSFGDWSTVKEPEIGVEGVKTRTCSECGFVEEAKIPAIVHGETDHVFDGKEEIIKEATCTEKGIRRIYCSFEKCNAYEDIEIDAKGHSVGEWKVISEADCTNSGLKEQYCTVCHEKCDEEVSPALGHDYGEWKTTVEAGLNKEGEEERICNRCGVKETRKISAIIHEDKDHIFNGKSEVIREAECEKDGILRVYCSFPECSAYQDTAIAAKGHMIEGWKTVKNPTCTQEGEKEAYCKVCGKLAETATIPALGHQFGDWVIVKEATFKEDGLQERICEVCGDKLEAIIPKLSESHEHDFSGKSETVKEPTCTETGLVKIKCSNPECDAVKEMQTAAKGHSFGSWIILKEAGVGSEGLKERQCAVCGIKEQEKIELLKINLSGKGQNNDGGAKNNTVKTGDSAYPFVWLALIAISLGNIVGVNAARRRKNIR